MSVLIVDDDAGYRRVAGELLDARGYSVVGHAATAREALARTHDLGPDAILLDVQLPDGNGIAIARGLSARSESLRILLVSTDADAVSQDDLKACGAAGFVAKARLAGADLDHYLSGEAAARPPAAAFRAPREIPPSGSHRGPRYGR